jgi:hypothetical protein
MSVAPLLIALSLAAPPEKAAPKPPPKRPSVVVLAIDLDVSSRPAAVGAARIAEAAARRLGRQDVKDPVALIDQSGTKQREERFASGLESFNQGRVHYDNLELDQAVEVLDRSANAIEKSNLAEHFDDWVRSVQLRVAARFVAGDAATAKADLAKLWVVWPRMEFDKSQFAPDVIAAAAQAKSDLTRTATRVDIDVKADPVSARVYLDGNYMGPTPATLTKIPMGEHFLTLTAPGFAVYQERIRVTAGLNVRASLSGADGKAKYLALVDRVKRSWHDPSPQSRAEATQELGKWLGVEEVALVGVSREGASLLVQGVRSASGDKHVLGVVEERLPESDPRLYERMNQVLGPLFEKDKPREGGKANTSADVGFRWSPRATGWSVLGAGGALAITGGVFGYLAYSNNKTYRSSAQTDLNAAALADSGQTQAHVADVLVGVGVVGAIVGGYLVYLHRADNESVRLDERGDEPPPPGTVDTPAEPPPEKKKKKPVEEDPFSVAPAPFPGGGGFVISGRF